MDVHLNVTCDNYNQIFKTQNNITNTTLRYQSTKPILNINSCLWTSGKH